jgi:hypothetical protein
MIVATACGWDNVHGMAPLDPGVTVFSRMELLLTLHGIEIIGTEGWS